MGPIKLNYLLKTAINDHLKHSNSPKSQLRGDWQGAERGVVIDAKLPQKGEFCLLTKLWIWLIVLQNKKL